MLPAETFQSCMSSTFRRPQPAMRVAFYRGPFRHECPEVSARVFPKTGGGLTECGGGGCVSVGPSRPGFSSVPNPFWTLSDHFCLDIRSRGPEGAGDPPQSIGHPDSRKKNPRSLCPERLLQGTCDFTRGMCNTTPVALCFVTYFYAQP